VGQRQLRADALARFQRAARAEVGFAERLVHFWSNHFCISAAKGPLVRVAAGCFEREAIRPHVLGRFSAMLQAVESHPAMLAYLDNALSFGPNSPAGRNRNRGLNENLAREILELHTLGVRSGYTQGDVTEFARALTGWSLAGQAGAGQGEPAPAAMAMDGAQPGGFQFRPALHEPGARSLLGRSYADAGEGQGLAILHDLAAAPATARHVATKLARHFVADDPPPAVVDRLVAAFQRSGGDLPTVYRALVESPEAWTAGPGKFKTPWDWTLSSLRALGRRELSANTQAAPLLNQLGQPVWRPGSPAGYDDVAASWAAPDALVRRVELAQRLAAQTGDSVDPRTLAPRLLPGDALRESTATAIARAESASTGLALLLVSPEFLRR
jgi:uncharacterized protein (DUF1800 family)